MDTAASGRETTSRGKHRTEVTEVTEGGDWGWRMKAICLSGTPWLRCENEVKWEIVARINAREEKKLSTPNPISPLCDLRDLCAMLIPLTSFLAQKPRCPPKNFQRLKPNFPSSVTSVRCSAVCGGWRWEGTAAPYGASFLEIAS